MKERDHLLRSISEKIKTYRRSEVPEPTPDHVDRWASQFTASEQLVFLREFNAVTQKRFLTRRYFENLFRAIIVKPKLVGKDSVKYWATANFLNIQKHGQSQRAMLKIFAECLKDECGLSIEDCGREGGDFIYLDDVIFTGFTVANDLGTWISTRAPSTALVNVIASAIHYKQYQYQKAKLDEKILLSGKDIKITWWRDLVIEGPRENGAELLCPVEIPKAVEVKAYLNSLSHSPRLRTPRKGSAGPFFSESGRQVLEREFLIAGSKIIAKIENRSASTHPLGYAPFGPGFGSMIATYRNCPNNCPLALWWGDPTVTSGPLRWYPLLPRKVHS